jgi:hypothetical protein
MWGVTLGEWNVTKFSEEGKAFCHLLGLVLDRNIVFRVSWSRI